MNRIITDIPNCQIMNVAEKSLFFLLFQQPYPASGMKENKAVKYPW